MVYWLARLYNCGCAKGLCIYYIIIYTRDVWYFTHFILLLLIYCYCIVVTWRVSRRLTCACNKSPGGLKKKKKLTTYIYRYTLFLYCNLYACARIFIYLYVPTSYFISFCEFIRCKYIYAFVRQIWMGIYVLV